MREQCYVPSAYPDLHRAGVNMDYRFVPTDEALTFLLADKVKQVIAIELDKRLVQELQPKVPRNVLVIHADALTIDYSRLPRFTKIVSNLPFQISSPFTFKILNYPFL